MTEARPLDIIIIGAGIAGLTAAGALGRQGHHVVVLEKSKFNKETGAAINAPPNCTALLEWMDIDLRDYGGTLLEEVNRHDHQGAVKFYTDLGPIRKFWQAEYYLVQRCDLHGALKAQALKSAKVHTGCEIVSIDTSASRPSVTLEDGRVFEGDLLIGADGLHSIVRKKIAPNAPSPTPSDKCCFRWLLSASDIRELGTTKHVVRRGALMEWAEGGKARLVMYPCANNEVLNLVAFIPTAKVGRLGKGYEATGNKGILMNGFENFCPEVRELVKRAGDDLKVWQLSDMEALPRYVVERAALIGDAAHPFQPYLGQGGAMAIEDAVSLAVLLPMGTTVNDIARRLELYENIRRPRVEMTLHYTALNARNEDRECTDPKIAAKMAKIMGQIGAHNEVANSTAVLQEELTRCASER
ncbi:hypothetical protein BDW66DRAFT_157852 [Aspergillus desertorum]